jgi:hypothetical protein
MPMKARNYQPVDNWVLPGKCLGGILRFFPDQ